MTQPEGAPRAAVIGTGTMGSALARALLAAGHQVTVWNRTRSRAEPLAAAGAGLAGSPAGAAAAADVVIMCVSDQAAATGLLSDPALPGALAGKVLIQATTGTPADGRRNADWATARGIGYADVAMLAYPRQIGSADAVILYCGPAAADPAVRSALAALGTARPVGADAGRASVADAALIAFFYGTMAGFLHAATLAAAEGMPIGELEELSGPVLAGFITNAVNDTAQRIASGDYSAPQSSMDTHFGGIDLLVLGTSQAAGVDTQVVTAIRDAFARALAAGHGADDIAVLAEMWRAPG